MSLNRTGRHISMLGRRIALAAALLIPLPALAQEIEERQDLQSLFTEAGTTGTLVVHDYKTDKVIVVGKSRSEQPYSPSSTFKIPNTLIALRVGAISGMDEPIPAPSEPFLVRGKPFLPDACNATATVALALQNSCIPAYQDIAGRIGVVQYNEFLMRMNYAPASVTAANLKEFWLTGAIALSARDQVAFLDRMIAGRVPIQPAHIEAMWAALAAGESPKGQMFAKTGYVFTSTPDVGWYVGWIRKDGEATATFALNLDITAPEHARARPEIALKALAALGLW